MDPRSAARHFLVFMAVVCRASDQQTQESALGSCRGQDLREYTIRSARVEDPFWFLRWRKLDQAVQAEVAALKGKPYTFAAVKAVSQKVEDNGWLPDTPDVRARFDYSDVAVEKCEAKELDVVFFVFSVQFSSTLSGVMESRAKEKGMPSQAVGVSDILPKVQVAPEAGFDAARNFVAGGRLRASIPNFGSTKLEVDGRGSLHSRKLRAGLTGQYDSATGWLGHADWRFDFQNAVQPVGSGQIAESRGAAQFAGATRQMKGMVARFGGSLSGGNLQSSFLRSDLATGTVGSSAFTSAKLFGGVTGRARHQAYSISYALGLGSTGKAFHGDWSKHLADVGYEIWVPFGDHRTLDWEQRFNAGGIRSGNKLPAAERFFGGNAETPYVEFDSWKIRGNPVVRSIPYNRLAQTVNGVGGDTFFSYNSTVGVTVWRKPLIPEELAKDPAFQGLSAQLNTGRSLMQIYYRAKDSHFVKIVGLLPVLATQMEAVKTTKAAVETQAPATLKPLFSACTSAWSMANTAVKFAVKGKALDAYGWVKEMLPDGDNPLGDVGSECQELVSGLKTAGVNADALEAALAAVEKSAQSVVTEFGQIDENAAKVKADADFAFADRTLQTITREMNISSISPVAIFDVGRIGPQDARSGGNRYAIGGGIRFTLVSTASFTLGYAVNPNRRPGESRGAFFFSLTTRNLFE